MRTGKIFAQPRCQRKDGDGAAFAKNTFNTEDTENTEFAEEKKVFGGEK